MTENSDTGLHPRASMSQISSWNWTLEQDLEFYATQGWRQVGLHHRKLEAHGLKDAIQRVRAADLDVTNLIASSPVRVADQSTWDDQRNALLRFAEDAAACGSPNLCTTTGPADGLPWEQAVARLDEIVAPILDELAVPLVFEHTNLFRVDLSFLVTLRDAITVGQRLGVGVCVETNTCWSEGELATTVEGGIDTIALVQVSDFVVGTSCTADRAVIGDGDIPWAYVLGLFEDAGYRGVYDIEMIGPKIEEEGYATALPRCADALSAILDDQAVEVNL